MLFSALYFPEVRLQGLSNIHKLIVISVSSCWYLNSCTLPLGDNPIIFVIYEPCVRCDSRTTGIIVPILTLPRELSKFTLRGAADMRRKQDYQVTSFSHMRSECVVA